MNVFPLHQMNLEEAKQKQFEFVDAICKEFSGYDVLSLGDLGVRQPLNKPKQTEKVERVLADFFHTEKALKYIRNIEYSILNDEKPSIKRKKKR